MKPVNVETVRDRINLLETAQSEAGALSLAAEFELACLRQLLVSLEAKPVAWRWEKNNGLYFEGIKPIGVDSQPLYTTPPVNALRLPDGLIPYPSNDVKEVANNAGWNACLAEVDRLNATAPADDLDAKRLAFIAGMQDETAPEQYESLRKGG